jgi:outer membrane lipoprotein carrier protein
MCLGWFSLCAVTPVFAAGLGDVIRALETPFQAETDKDQRIYDYSADFFQESRIASLDRMQRASGRVEVAFDYRDPRTVPRVRFSWQYEQPTTQEIVSNGETLWVYLPENNQVILSDIGEVNRAGQEDPMAFLTGLGNLSRDFSIGFAPESRDVGGNYVLELRPYRPSNLIRRLTIVVDRYAVDAYQRRAQQEGSLDSKLPVPPQPGNKDFFFPGYEGGPNDLWFPIVSTTVFDPSGNSTVIEFSNLRVNSGLPGANFEFILPAGVNVVRPTGKEMGF